MIMFCHPRLGKVRVRMINRPFRTVLARLGLVAAILATLLILAPVALAAEEIDYEENRTDPVATLSATDEDGDDIDWMLSGDDAGDFKISDDGVLEFKKSPNYESPADANKNNVYLVSVTASETSNALELEITVTDADEAGKVSFGGQGRFQPQVGRGLEASLTDPDAPVEDERWQWARGASADGPWTDIDRATSPSRSPVADDLNMYLRATVTYDDKFDEGKTESAVSENAVEERTTANAAPSFASLDDRPDDPNTPAVENPGTQVHRDVDEGLKSANVGKPIRATDANNDVLVYSIDTVVQTSSGTADAADGDVTSDKLFSIDTRSGQLKTSGSTALNSDDDNLTGADDTTGTGTPAIPEVTYTVTVRATDPSGASATQPVTVTVNDVNDAPTFAKYDPDASPAQNNNAMTLYVVENTPASLSNDEDAAEAATGDSPTAVTGDDVANYQATDADATDGVAADGPPAVVGLTYEVMGADASAFTSPLAVTAGVATLAFKSDHKVNFEAKDEYEISIVASDDSAPEGTGKVDVKITVINAEDNGVVTPTQRQPQVGKEVVASLSDGDGDIRNQKWQWFRNADSSLAADAQETALSADGVPECTPTTGGTTLCMIEGATSPNYTPVLADIPYDTADPPAVIPARRLAARVTYNDKYVTLNTETPPTDAGDMMHVVMQAVVQLENPANTAPKFRDDQDANTPGDQPDAERSVPENANNTNVGDPVTASDADLLIYSLSGGDGAFKIDSGLKAGDTPGQIKTAMKLDFETKDMYTVVVTAIDPSGATNTINVNIEVTDVDDKTVVTLVNMMDGEIDYDEGGTDPVATLSAMDQDGDDIDWMLSGDDAGDFKISDDGVLEFKSKPNYESPADDNKNNVYLVSVTASETSNTLNLEITVMDVDEAGKISFGGQGRFQPQVGRVLEASLTDPDAPVEDESWQWARGPSASGPWTDIDRATSPSRSPVADDLNMYLRATVTYDDKFDEGKTESAVSENAVEERTTANAAPSFASLDDRPDDPNTPAVENPGTQVHRDVDEGLKSANVGKPIRATDANNDVLVYSIDTVVQTSSGTADAADGDVTSDKLFSIDTRSGQLKTSGSTALNSDDDNLTGADDTTGTGTPAIPEVTYTVTVRATDPSGASATQPVTVTVNDVNDAPTFAKYDPDASPAQNNNAMTLYVVENTPASLSNDEDAAEAATGDSPTAVTGDDVANYQATDADATDGVAADGPPAVVGLTYEVMGADASAFTSPLAVTAGVATLAFKSDHKVNFEAKDEYEISIVASDDSAPEGTGKVDVKITVINAEDNGVVTPTQRQPQVGKEVVASLSDGDGDIRNQKWQWFRNADSSLAADAQETALSADGVPECTPTTGGTTLCMIEGATSPNYTPVLADIPYDTADPPAVIPARRLAARVTYNDKYVTLNTETPPTDAGDMMHVVMQAVVQLENPANTAPKFRDDQDANTPGDQPDAERSVPENANNTNVGDPVTASDADLLIYSLSGGDGAFKIDSGLKAGDTPGQIKTAMKLDFETKDMYTVVVTATDPSGATDTINVNIEVTDVDDKTVVTLGAPPNNPPVFDAGTGDGLMVYENMAAGTSVGTIMATDEDGDTLEYSLGDDAMYFAIDGTSGEITTTMSLDYEMMASHMVTVSVSDGDDSASMDVTIAVGDMYPGCTVEGNAALTNDCETLLTVKDELAGDGDLSAWSEDIPVSQWHHVVVSGDPMRVTEIRLSNKGDLDGSIPAGLGYLDALVNLYLNGNSLSGSIPGSLGMLTSLQDLRLHGNDLESIGEGLGGATSLARFWAHGNSLSGSIPADLGDLDNLQWLRLDSQSGDGLTGGIPAELGNLDSIERLYLHSNMLGGAIPAELGNLDTLTHITLQRNGLTGGIPDLSGLTSLVWLGLYDNELTGTIPTSLGALMNLERLYLHGNSLTGAVPAAIGNLSNLTNLWLKNNSLSGTLPDTLDNLTNLERVRISGNDFTGCVPAALDTDNDDIADSGLEVCASDG